MIENERRKREKGEFKKDKTKDRKKDKMRM